MVGVGGGGPGKKHTPLPKNPRGGHVPRALSPSEKSHTRGVVVRVCVGWRGARARARVYVVCVCVCVCVFICLSVRACARVWMVEYGARAVCGRRANLGAQCGNLWCTRRGAGDLPKRPQRP